MEKIYEPGSNKALLKRRMLYFISIVLVYFLIKISVNSLRNSILIMIALAATLYIVIPGRKRLISLTSLWVLTIFLTFIGSNIGAVEMGSYHIFPSRIMLVLYWGIFILIIIRNKGRIYIGSGNMKKYLLFFVIWILWGILSFVWSASKIDSIRYAIFLIQGFSLVLFTIYNFNSFGKIRVIYTFWILLSFILMLIGLWENFTFKHLPSSHVGIEYGYNLTNLNIPSSIFTNPNDFAYFICLSLPFIIGFIILCRNIFIRLICSGFILLGFYLIVTTGSRSTMIGVMIQFLVIFVIILKKMKDRLSKNSRIILLVTLVAMLILVFVFARHIPIVSGIVNKFTNEIVSLKDKTNDDSISVRANLIKNGLHFLWNTFLMGIGAGNNEWYQLHKGIFPTMGIVNLHNWWIEILVNYGLVIFVLYISFLFSMVKKLFTIYRKSNCKEARIIAGAILLSFLGFPIAAISSSSIFADPTMWMLYGMALSVINVYGIKGEGRKII